MLAPLLPTTYAQAFSLRLSSSTPQVCRRTPASSPTLSTISTELAGNCPGPTDAGTPVTRVRRDRTRNPLREHLIAIDRIAGEASFTTSGDGDSAVDADHLPCDEP